jgi:hypothetical protein
MKLSSALLQIANRSSAAGDQASSLIASRVSNCAGFETVFSQLSEVATLKTSLDLEAPKIDSEDELHETTEVSAEGETGNDDALDMEPWPTLAPGGRTFSDFRGQGDDGEPLVVAWARRGSSKAHPNFEQGPQSALPGRDTVGVGEAALAHSEKGVIAAAAVVGDDRQAFGGVNNVVENANTTTSRVSADVQSVGPPAVMSQQSNVSALAAQEFVAQRINGTNGQVRAGGGVLSAERSGDVVGLGQGVGIGIETAGSKIVARDVPAPSVDHTKLRNFSGSTNLSALTDEFAPKPFDAVFVGETTARLPAAVPQAPEARMHPTQQILPHLPDLANLKAGQIDITLSPEELGRVRLSSLQTDQGVVLVIQAERPETLELMRRNMGDLLQDLRAMGFEDISYSDPGDGDRQPSEESKPTLETALENEQAPLPLQIVEGGLDLRL